MDIHKLSYHCGTISFGVGSLIFILYKLTVLEIYISLGILFIAVAAIINGLVFLVLLTEMMKEESDKRKCRVSSAMLLVNIPIAFVYFLVVVNSEIIL